jgi:integrase
LILTGARTDEVIGRKERGVWLKAPPTWSEIGEIEGKPVWTIPAWHEDGESFRGMKGGKDHIMPLSPAALALLGERQANDVPLFKVRNQNALLDTLRAHHDDYTVHGMRSSFSDWGIENRYSRDLVDMCIAHGEERDTWVDEKTRKAYQRSELLALRREVMEKWSDFVTKGKH